MQHSIELPPFLPDQNQLYAYYLSRCGTHRVGRPHRSVLALLEEDAPAHYRRLRREAKERAIEDWTTLEEVENDSEEVRAQRVQVVPLAKKKVFQLADLVHPHEPTHVGTRGMMAVLDLVAQLPLLEELDFSSCASWFVNDAFAHHAQYTGNHVIARMCKVVLDAPSIARVRIVGQPIGTLAAQQIFELCCANRRIVEFQYSTEGVDYRLVAQIEKVLERNRSERVEAPSLLPTSLPPCMLRLPYVDRKTVLEQQILRGLLESDANIAGLLGEEEMAELVMRTRVMTTSEVVTRCAREGLRGDNEHLFVLKTGRLRAFTDLVGFSLERGDYFGERYGEVLFPTCRLAEEERGKVYAVPLAYCAPILATWKQRLTAFYPFIRQVPLFQPLSTWCHARLCTCAVECEFGPGDVALPANDSSSHLYVVREGTFYALAGPEEAIDRTGRFTPYPFHVTDVFGSESVVARKHCSSVPIIAGKENTHYVALRISHSGYRLVADQLSTVLKSLVRPYSIHEDVCAVVLTSQTDDIKVHRV